MTEEVKVEPTQETAIAQNPETKQEPTETIEQINWRKFRQEKEELRKKQIEAQEIARKKQEENLALQKALEAVVSKPNHAEPEEVDLSDDQKIELKVQEALKKREMEWERQRIEKESQELPERLQSTFRDFNQVCTTENLDYLEYHYPEIAEAYKHMPEGYKKWEGIYKALKRFIPVKESGKEGKKAENNLSKPGALSRPGMTQTGDQAPTMMLNDERRASNWARMQKVIKGI